MFLCLVLRETDTFTVKGSTQGTMTCSCHRFFDEGIPCQHLIKVIDFAQMGLRPSSLISQLYAVSRFTRAFPDELPFFPRDGDFFSANISVILPSFSPKRGAPQNRRIASTGEYILGNIRTHRVSCVVRKVEQPILPCSPESVEDDWADSEQKKKNLDQALACRVDFQNDCFSEVMKYVRQQQESDCNDSSSSLAYQSVVNESSSNLDNQSVVDDCLSDESSSLDLPNSQIVVRGPNFIQRKNELLPSNKEKPVKAGAKSVVKSDVQSCAMPVVTSAIQSSAMPVAKSHAAKRPHQEKRGTKRMRLMLPERYADLVQHDDKVYDQWEHIYNCFFSAIMNASWLEENDKPTVDNPAVVPLVPQVPFDEENCQQSWSHMTCQSDWDESIPIPIISVSLIRCFLARVHAFTAVGLEAQATAFSCEEDGVIKYLALLPQRNTVTSVSSRSTGPTELDALERLKSLDPKGKYIPRCWIHTHPRWKAFMSPTDIYQLYICACENRQSFGIVLSPRGQGLKALCVHLTQSGFEEVAGFCQDATTLQKDVMQHVILRISQSPNKFYCQIPFDVSSELCHIIDLRGEEVIRQLCDFIVNDEADKCWICPPAM